MPTGQPKHSLKSKAAAMLGVSAPAVSNWRNRFAQGRVSGLHDALKSGRPRAHSDEQVARLINTVLTKQPKSSTH